MASIHNIPELLQYNRFLTDTLPYCDSMNEIVNISSSDRSNSNSNNSSIMNINGGSSSNSKYNIDDHNDSQSQSQSHILNCTIEQCILYMQVCVS